jgi:hypothetical protein
LNCFDGALSEPTIRAWPWGSRSQLTPATALGHAALGGATLLLASDGLLRYGRASDITRIASGPDLDAAARALVELVRLPSGTLQDDVAVVLCRRAE